MNGKIREKFATQINSEILAEVRAVAEAEGRQIQSLMDEAIGDWLEKRRQSRPRAHVMTAYQRSHETYAELYKKLAQ